MPQRSISAGSVTPARRAPARMASSTARPCLRSASDCVNSKRSACASSRGGQRPVGMRGFYCLREPGKWTAELDCTVHTKMCRNGRFARPFCISGLAFCQIDHKILPTRQKKGGGMAKAKVLKFDAAGTGLSKSEILKVCEAENVRFMRLQFTDIFGVIKNVELPSSQF